LAGLYIPTTKWLSNFSTRQLCATHTHTHARTKQECKKWHKNVHLNNVEIGQTCFSANIQHISLKSQQKTVEWIANTHTHSHMCERVAEKRVNIFLFNPIRSYILNILQISFSLSLVKFPFRIVCDRNGILRLFADSLTIQYTHTSVRTQAKSFATKSIIRIHFSVSLCSLSFPES